jgi:hypothetical protein
MAALLFMALVGGVAAIYPSDHWDYATQITSEAMFTDLVKSTVDGDGSLMVRWIASAG